MKEENFFLSIITDGEESKNFRSWHAAGTESCTAPHLVFAAVTMLRSTSKSDGYTERLDDEEVVKVNMQASRQY